MIAVMAKYSPFAERAGMQKIAEQESGKSLKKLNQMLIQLGFNLQLIGSRRYVESKLDSLTEKQVGELKIAFMANKHPRFKKEVAASRHQPFGKTSDYLKYVEFADNTKISRLIKTLAMLSQTKVYLFWMNLDNIR